MTVEETFRTALRESGIGFDGPIDIDGKLHRFKAGDDHAKNSWYVLHSGPPVVGAYGCWKRDVNETWCERDGNICLTREEVLNLRRRKEEVSAKLKAQTEARQKKARKTAEWILNRSRPARTPDRYLQRKRVKPFGNLRWYRRSLVVPLRDEKGELHSLQFIDAAGEKRFLTGGRVAGCFFTLADNADKPLVLCESYATGASIHEATGYAVISAMSSGNLLEVAKTARQLWREREIIVAADNDQWTVRPPNPGLTKATAAAKAIGAKLAVPHFEDVRDKPTDFNDLATAQGLDAVRQQIGSARPVIEATGEPAAPNPSETETEDAAITRLARLSDKQYDKARKKEAKALGYSLGTLDKEVKKMRRSIFAPHITEPKRPLPVTAPKTAVTFKGWQKTIRDNFPGYTRAAEICASVFAQLLINDVANPFAIALVDVPSSGKTITLNFFVGVEELAYTSDSFTPASFVSHATNVRREELAEIDMLPRIRYRTLIIRDLASIFGAKDDDLLKMIGIFTRVLDGEGLRIDSGVHGSRGYEGDYLFMLLAGTTPLPPRVFKVMGTLGSRLFFLALHSEKKNAEELISQNRGVTRLKKERACKEATDLFLRGLWRRHPKGVDWDKDDDPDTCLRVVARCAELLAALRGTIQVWQSEEGNYSHNVPQLEQPDRINCLLCNLARGHALLCGRRQIVDEDLAPVLEVTFDSGPTIRSKVFRELLARDGTLTTAEIKDLLRCSKATALKEMEVLSILDVAAKVSIPQASGQPSFVLSLADKFQWFVSDECKGLRWPKKQ